MNKIALVTGGNRGIGFEICRGLAQNGVKVILAARKPVEGEAAAAKLKAEGLDVVFMPLDVADQASVDTLKSEVKSRFGGLDILINNAGVYLDRGGSIMTTTPETLMATYEINVAGPLRLMVAFIPLMKRDGSARIVNLSSRMGSLELMGSGSPAYRSSKSALNALTRVAAAENPHIRINAMHPGWVHTKMGGAAAPLTPEEGADTAIWLALIPDDGPTGGFFSDRAMMAW